MQIIPVIDIKNSLVVKAIKGNRALYQPIKSPICSSPRPVDVISALIDQASSLCRITTIYIADLDAIESNGNNYALIDDLGKNFPDLQLWVDAGFRTLHELNEWKKIPRLVPVIGTESHQHIMSIKPMLQENVILSLDFKNQQLLGSCELLEMSTFWPENVVIMMLDTIGSHSGPDLGLIDRVMELAKNSGEAIHLYAAGGVRDDNDLRVLTDKGIQGVLLASALHNQRLNSRTLSSSGQKNAPRKGASS